MMRIYLLLVCLMINPGIGLVKAQQTMVTPPELKQPTNVWLQKQGEMPVTVNEAIPNKEIPNKAIPNKAIPINFVLNRQYDKSMILVIAATKPQYDKFLKQYALGLGLLQTDLSVHHQVFKNKNGWLLWYQADSINQSVYLQHRLSLPLKNDQWFNLYYKLHQTVLSNWEQQYDTTE
jgi:hypothetical protein